MFETIKDSSLVEHSFGSWAGAAFLFLIRQLIEGAQRVFDALHGAERIVGVQIHRVNAPPPDKEFRHRFAESAHRHQEWDFGPPFIAFLPVCAALVESAAASCRCGSET